MSVGLTLCMSDHWPARVDRAPIEDSSRATNAIPPRLYDEIAVRPSSATLESPPARTRSAILPKAAPSLRSSVHSTSVPQAVSGSRVKGPAQTSPNPSSPFGLSAARTSSVSASSSSPRLLLNGVSPPSTPQHFYIGQTTDSSSSGTRITVNDPASLSPHATTSSLSRRQTPPPSLRPRRSSDDPLERKSSPSAASLFDWYAQSESAPPSQLSHTPNTTIEDERRGIHDLLVSGSSIRATEKFDIGSSKASNVSTVSDFQYDVTMQQPIFFSKDVHDVNVTSPVEDEIGSKGSNQDHLSKALESKPWQRDNQAYLSSLHRAAVGCVFAYVAYDKLKRR